MKINSIETARAYFKTFSDDKLLDEYDLYVSIKKKGINELIYQQIIEHELNERDLLDIKISEDMYEQQHNHFI